MLVIFTSTRSQTYIRRLCLDSYAESVGLEAHQSLCVKALKTWHGHKVAQTICTYQKLKGIAQDVTECQQARG